MKKKDILTLEESENGFLFKENKSNLNISFNRVAFIFFVFISVCLIYLIKILYLGLQQPSLSKNQNKQIIENFRADIVDRNNNFIAKTVNTTIAGVNPNLIIDQDRLLLNLKIIFPDQDINKIKNKIKKKKYFRIKKQITSIEKEKLKSLGDKSIFFEDQISRIYPNENLYSHILGQIDDANNGISGLEKKFDFKLRSEKLPIKLSVDTEVQFLIREELIKFNKIFRSVGSAAILMDVNNGEILSLVSLPDFNLNERVLITDKNYINRITKGVYELGSVFKTFTIAAALNEELIEPETEFLNLEKEIRCGGRSIREYDTEIPENINVEQILIRSGNIGSVRIGQMLGIDRLKKFYNDIGILNRIDFDIDEVGLPIPFKWGKCKLATVSFGHGITTTPLQLAKGYSILSNGGFYINPTLILKKKKNESKKNKIIEKDVSIKINHILRKIVSSDDGTASLANVSGYEIGGKTGTAQKVIDGKYSRLKINTFASIFPTSNPKFVLVVLIDEPKTSKDYIYKYRNKSGSYKGTPFNTAGWTSVEIVGNIIDKIGPILATKYIDVQ
ncbi:penicillin-binding protein 2 [Candidatus Pelagibacter sp.]|nr:penicillin-binding protein 2 [Candidatus Pelagibacter sp.]